MSEILGTLFKYLMMLLGVAAVVYILHQVLTSNKVSQTVSDITQMQSNVNALYAGQSSYASLTTAVAITASAIPTDMNPASGTPTDVWGGPVTLGPDANPQWFDISLGSVPVADCTKIAGSIGGYKALDGTPGPLTPAQVETACGGSSTMVFAFGQ
jgi:hypothetical protein